MTTFEPGARVVFTHGLAARPRSTALRASSAAPIITCGLEVLVQDVMEAMTTEPWSSSNEAPPAVVYAVGLCARATPLGVGGSEAGKLSSDCASTLSLST